VANQDPLRDPAPLIREVYAYVAYRIGGGVDAEDVTSQVFERAVRYRNSYDAGRGTPIAWLIGIARRVMNGDAPPPPFPIDEATGGVEGADMELEVVNRVTLQDVVASLSERDRELIALRFGADLTTRQIGELIGASPGAVDVAIHRAIERLRTRLDRP
jgi:DNA-directed RNA polymerase specialized sigma24 family protein